MYRKNDKLLVHFLVPRRVMLYKELNEAPSLLAYIFSYFFSKFMILKTSPFSCEQN